LLKKYNPQYLAIETLYFFKNMKTALPVSEARGVILLTAAKKRIRIEEYTPLQVKMKICGHGRAEKKEVQETLKKILKLKEIPRPDDASDALAIAISSLGN
jgi:crossover junction endodeoxyribonuclease RuvC